MTKSQTPSSLRSDAALVLGSMLAGIAISRHFSRTVLSHKNVELHEHTPAALTWRNILLRVWRQIEEDRLLATAAGVVFYGLLATFPAVTALVSSYGLFADPSTIASQLRSLALMLPEGSFSVVQEQIDRVTSHGGATLSIAFFASLALALWSANAGMKAIMDALNVVYDAKETRGFFKLNIVSLLLTIGGLAAVLLMVTAVVVLPLFLQRIGLDSHSQTIASFGRWPAMAFLLIAGLAVLYRFGPDRRTARFQLFSVGSVAAAMVWLAGSALLSWYLSNFGEYNATYGSLGAAIGLMMWMWMSATVVLCGAELDSEIENVQKA